MPLLLTIIMGGMITFIPLHSLGIQSLIHNSVYSIPTTFNEPDPAGY